MLECFNAQMKEEFESSSRKKENGLRFDFLYLSETLSETRRSLCRHSHSYLPSASVYHRKYLCVSFS